MKPGVGTRNRNRGRKTGARKEAKRGKVPKHEMKRSRYSGTKKKFEKKQERDRQ